MEDLEALMAVEAVEVVWGVMGAGEVTGEDLEAVREVVEGAEERGVD